MKRIVWGIAAGVMLLAWQGTGFAAAAKSSCLTCHTNGAMMKAMYKPPKIEGGEAEG